MSNTIVKASAGSGKTFQLSNRFLRIVFGAERTSEEIGAILASTFTRKAAGEISDRILSRLAEAALDTDKQADFVKHVPLPVKHKAERTKLLQRTVSEIAKNLYRLRICTLDSFFNRIATSFALELALPPGWAIMEETGYQNCIHEAVQEVFEESHKNEARRLLHLLQKGNEDLRVTQEIVALTKDFLPLVRNTDASAWDHTVQFSELTCRKLADETIHRYIAPFLDDPDLRESILPRNKSKGKSTIGELDSNYKKAFDAFLGNCQAQNWEALLVAGLGKGIVSGENKYNKKQIEPPLFDFLNPLVQHATAILMETIIHQTTATRDMLELVWKKLETILLTKRGFRFEDITFTLGELFHRKPLSQQLLAHRMDTPTKHLLLDEFQDTSLSQWDILKPFVQSVYKSKATTFFCVGDLKQAIYSWRGGVAEIFETVSDFLENEGADIPEMPSMNETRRNSQAVIDAVNMVFLNIGTNAAVCEKSPTAAAKWHEWFGNNKHETLSTSKTQGYCVLEAVPTSDASDDDSEEVDVESPFWQYTLDRVVRLHRKHPARSIGVLFRAGKDIATVLKGLKRRNIEASDEGGVALTDSAAVQHVLSVMKLIDHPGDTIVRFHLAKGPLADVLPLQEHGDNFAAEKTARHWRKKLLTQGYGKTVRELVAALSPCEPKEAERLEKLLELAYRFDEQAFGTRTRQFLETVDASRLASPSAAAIRVMTIHKAKGLEFDIVVLPDLNGRLVGTPPKIVVSRSSPAEPVNFVLRWVNQNLRELLPECYQQAFVQWQDDQVKESLAVLYVAMTRARHELVMLVPEKSNKGSYAGVLRSGFNAAEGSGTLYQSETGDENWDNDVKVEQEEPPEIAWHALADKPLWRNLPRTSPSELELKLALQHAKAETAELSAQSRDDAKLRGTAIHACFASVKWLEDGTLDAKVLHDIVEQAIAGKRGHVEPSEVVRNFLAMCEQPEVRKVLMRSSYPSTETIDVENERRFSVRLKDELLHGSMDRLVIRKLGNEVIGLEIIDFKSDRPMAGESLADFFAERNRVYAPQLEAYRVGAARLYPNVRNISTRLLFVSQQAGDISALSSRSTG